MIPPNEDRVNMIGTACLAVTSQWLGGALQSCLWAGVSSKESLCVRSVTVEANGRREI